MLHATIEHCSGILFLATLERDCRVDVRDIRNTEGLLSGPEEFEMIMDKVNEMKAAIYGRSEERNVKVLANYVGAFNFISSIILGKSKKWTGVGLEDVHSILLFEPMHGLHLG